jgi:hypothetical protein
MDDKIKVAGVALLGVIAIAMALYFLLLPNDRFNPGAQVDQGTFADIFWNSTDVVILSDVRGVDDATNSRNILQCQVDFASSSGMGGKNVTYLSIGADGCYAVDGKHPDTYCFQQGSKAVSIYIHQGNTTSFYSNGMTVGVDANYTFGTCGIKRL